MDTKVVTTWAQLQADVVRIAARIQRDPTLTLAALANPALALEELGYELDPSFELEFEHRVRFGPDTIGALSRLRDEVFKFTDDMPFNLNAPEELGKALRGLEIDVGDTDLSPPDPVPPFDTKADVCDPLAVFADKHPIFGPLLAYRVLDASAPRLAPREVYESVRQGALPIPFQGFQIQFQTKVDKAG